MTDKNEIEIIQDIWQLMWNNNWSNQLSKSFRERPHIIKNQICSLLKLNYFQKEIMYCPKYYKWDKSDQWDKKVLSYLYHRHIALKLLSTQVQISWLKQQRYIKSGTLMMWWIKLVFRFKACHRQKWHIKICWKVWVPQIRQLIANKISFDWKL